MNERIYLARGWHMVLCQLREHLIANISQIQ